MNEPGRDIHKGSGTESAINTARVPSLPVTPGLPPWVMPPAPGSPLGFEEEPAPGQALVAIGVSFIPLALALYAILDAGKGLGPRLKFAFSVGTTGAYGVALVILGLLLVRTAERAIVGRTLIVSGGVLSSFVAAASWFNPTSNLVLLSTAGAAFLMGFASGAYTRLWKRPTRTVIPLVVAVVLVGISGRLVAFSSRADMIVLDALAGVLACGVFLRAGKTIEPPGKIVLALSVPLAALIVKVMWWTTLPQLAAIMVTVLWALPALRPYVYDGTVTLISVGVLGAALVPALGTLPSRHISVIVALGAMVRLSDDVERDRPPGAMDQRAPAWLAAIVWAVLAGTWAHDLSLIAQAFGVARGFRWRGLPWMGAFAVPLALPAFILAYLRRRNAPLDRDLEDPVPGGVAEAAGWLVLALSATLALVPGFFIDTGWIPLLPLGGAAATAAVWVRLGATSWRRVAAHLLLLLAIWAFARRQSADLVGLTASAVALALSLAPLVRGSVAAGGVGFALFPVLIADAMLQGAPAPAAAVLVGLFGIVQLVRPPLAEAPWTRVAGPLALIAAAWLLSAGSVEGAHGLLAIPAWAISEPLLGLGALSVVLSVPAFLLAQNQRRLAAPAPGDEPAPPQFEIDFKDPALVLESAAWVLVVAGAAFALTPIPPVTWPSVVTLGVAAVVTAGWARLVPTSARRGAAHVLLVIALWAFGVRQGSPVLFLAASAAACVLAIAPLPPLNGSVQAGWIGLVLFPIAIADALSRGAAALPAAGLLALFGVVFTVRPPLTEFPWTRVAGLPALLASGWLLLFWPAFGAAPLLPASAVATAAALALVPFAVWAALKVHDAEAPGAVENIVLVVEVLAGAIASLLVDVTPAALVPLVVLVGGRSFIGVLAAAPALLVGAAVVTVYGPAYGVDVAAVVLAAGGALLLRRLPLGAERVRWLGPIALAAAPLVLLFAPRAAASSWLPVDHLPLVGSLVVIPFAVWVLVRSRPHFLAMQTMWASALVGIASLGTAFLQPAGSPLATEMSIAALLGLVAALPGTRRLPEEVTPIVRGLVALGALVALVPMSSDRWHWPVALVGAIDVLFLGLAARKRGSLMMASWSIWLALPTAAWIAAALTERGNVGDPLRVVPAIGIAVAALGWIVLVRGSRWLAAPRDFLLPFVQICLTLASVAVGVTVLMVPASTASDVARALFLLLTVAGLALHLGLKDRVGWPFFVATTALVLPYVFLRARTGWLESVGHWDAMVAVMGGVVLGALEWPARRHAGVPVAAGPEDPESLPFGVHEIRVASIFVASLSAITLLDLHAPIEALGPALAALYFAYRARQGSALFGIMAAVFADAVVVALLVGAHVGSPSAYALPLGASMMVLMQLCRVQLGSDAGTLRAFPPLAIAAVCTFDAFDSRTLAPAIALGVLGLSLLVLSRLWRLRSHLPLGLLCLGAGLLSVLATAGGWRFDSGPSSGGGGGSTVLRLVPIGGQLFAVAGAFVLSRRQRFFPGPDEIWRPIVHACLALAAVAAAVTVLVAPATGARDVALALTALAAVVAFSVYLAVEDHSAWPLLLAGGTLVLPYVYLRARTGWLDPLQRWDAVVACAGGVLIGAFERLFRGGRPAPIEPRPLNDEPEVLPFGVREVRLVSAFVTALAAVAFLDLHAPIDALGPALATLFFVRRARTGSPVYGVLAALFVDALVVLFLLDRNVVSPAAFALPLAASIAVLMQIYRDGLGPDEATVRALPPIAAAAACAYQAVDARSAIASLTLAGLGVVLLLLSRVWSLRSHLPLGFVCLGGAVLTTINQWSARGWSEAAIALGVVTLLVPAALLRRR